MKKDPLNDENRQASIASFTMDYRDDKKKAINGPINRVIHTARNRQPQIRTESIFLDSLDRKQTKIEKPKPQSNYESYIEEKKQELIYNAKPIYKEPEVKNICKESKPKHISQRNIAPKLDIIYDDTLQVNKKTHKIIAMFLIFTLLVSVAAFVTKFRKEDILVNPYEYDHIIMPVVMQDIGAFDEISKIDKSKAINSAIWYLLIDSPEDSLNSYDDNGCRIIKFDDIHEPLKKLFGPNYTVDSSEIPESSLYTFNPSSKDFHIPLSSNRSCFLPYTDSAEVDKDGNIVLLVSYISPDDPYRCKEDGEAESPSPAKKMKYIIKGSPGNQESYISAVCEI